LASSLASETLWIGTLRTSMGSGTAVTFLWIRMRWVSRTMTG